MGDEVRPLLSMLSRLLEPAEREAVCGDLQEMNVSGLAAARDILGLVIRRQAALWLDWRPWLALVGVAVPIGLLLALISRWWAGTSAIYAFLYVNNWTWGHLASPGARHLLLETALRYFLLPSVALIGWSWTSGVVIGRLSRRAVWLTALIFAFAVLAAAASSIVPAAPSREGVFSGADAVFSIAFYRTVLPILVRVTLVLLPALAGMHRGQQQRSVSLRGAVIAGLLTTALTVWFVTSFRLVLLTEHVATSMSPAVASALMMLWPTAFIVGAAVRQRVAAPAP